MALGLCGCAVNRDLSSKQLVAGDCQFFDIPHVPPPVLGRSLFHISHSILCHFVSRARVRRKIERNDDISVVRPNVSAQSKG